METLLTPQSQLQTQQTIQQQAVKNNIPTPEKKTSSRKRKTKSSVQLTSD
jgi:hypothetical protein